MEDSVKSVVVFFFKQKTAYEIASCLVGSEMCIRDSPPPTPPFLRFRPISGEFGVTFERATLDSSV